MSHAAEPEAVPGGVPSVRRKVLVLGGGLVGSAIAADLASAQGFAVTVGDVDVRLGGRADALAARGVRIVRLDCTDARAVADACAAHADGLCVGAVPSPFGLRMLENVIRARCSIVDISFTPEDAFALAPLAREHGVCAIVDAGVAPGIPNLLFGAAARRDFERIERAVYYIGGLPTERCPPWDYVTLFCVSDTIEEFVRPARVKRAGEITALPVGSEIETMDFSMHAPGLVLEAFATDGLRSLLELPIPNMEEKTLRYPGHTARMLAMREAGDFDEGERLEASTARLAAEWAPRPGQTDMIVFRADVEGVRAGGAPARVSYRFFEHAADGLSAMARCTGFTCSSTLAMLADGKFPETGVFGLEHVALKHPAAADDILRRLREHNVRIEETVVDTPLPEAAKPDAGGAS